MRFASIGALSMLLATACGGASTVAVARAPVAVTEVSLEAEGSVGSEAPAVDDAEAEKLATIEAARAAGVLGVMSSDESDAFAAMLGTSSLDADVGGLQGATVGEGFGAGGLGLSGVGTGGGGTGEGTIGIGVIGLGAGGGIGAGTGSGRSGFGGGTWSTPQPRMTMGTPKVQGALDVQIVRRVLRRHTAPIRYCYAKEQVQAPQLAGEVRVAFTIAANGGVAVVSVASSTLKSSAVESCVLGRVRTMSFPQPEKGVVLVEVAMDFSPPPPSGAGAP